jgi:hypothetical protein
VGRKAGAVWAAALLLAAAEARPTAPPEIAAALRPDLAASSIPLAAAGAPLGELWPRRGLGDHRAVVGPAGDLAVHWLAPGELVGAIVLQRPWRDYKGQEIGPGAYTLRYALQPPLKDHAGTSTYRDFLLLLRADDDQDPAPVDASELIARSRRASGSGHPAVMAIAPACAPAVADCAVVVARPAGRLALLLSGQGRAEL